jgi:hypothetical protein
MVLTGINACIDKDSACSYAAHLNGHLLTMTAPRLDDWRRRRVLSVRGDACSGAAQAHWRVRRHTTLTPLTSWPAPSSGRPQRFDGLDMCELAGSRHYSPNSLACALR